MSASREEQTIAILDVISYIPPRNKPLLQILEGLEQDVLETFIQLNEIHWKDPTYKSSKLTLQNYTTGKVESIEGPSGKVETYFNLRQSFSALHRIFGLDVALTINEIPFDRYTWIRERIGFYNWRIRRLYEANFANELLENSYSRSSIERACKEHSEKCYDLFQIFSTQQAHDEAEVKEAPVSLKLFDEWDPRFVENGGFWRWDHFLTTDRHQPTPPLVQVIQPANERKEEEHKEPEIADTRLKISTEVEGNYVFFAHTGIALFSTPFIDPIRTGIFLPYFIINAPTHIVDMGKRINQLILAQQPKQNLAHIGAFTAGLGAGYAFGNYLPYVGCPVLGRTMSLVAGNIASVLASRAIKRYNRFFYGTETPDLLPTQQIFANVEAKNDLLTPLDISEMFDHLDSAIKEEEDRLREEQGFALVHKFWGFSWIQRSAKLRNLQDARSSLENGNIKEFVEKAEAATIEISDVWRLNIAGVPQLTIEELPAP